jgi:hypothetical protein
MHTVLSWGTSRARAVLGLIEATDNSRINAVPCDESSPRKFDRSHTLSLAGTVLTALHLSEWSKKSWCSYE